jgi:glycerol-3-phosphate dehydrogenase
MAYYDDFVRGCKECGIPIQELTTDEALRAEPRLNPATKGAVRVPDGTMDAMRMPLRFFATAKHHGAQLYNFMEVVGLLVHAGAVTGAAVRDHVTGTEGEISADVVVNATGPWSEKIARMAGVDVPIVPSPGVMLAVRGRLCNMVLNRMHGSGDGDIIVPQRALSVVGTSSWTVEDPDDLDVPEDHVRRMWEEGAKLIPAVSHAEFRAAWSAARPLIGSRAGDSGRELSRTFKTIDHADDGMEGFVTITGGKATTLRGMAELCGNVICAKLGIDRPSRTRTFVTLPHTAFYTDRDRRPA